MWLLITEVCDHNFSFVFVEVVFYMYKCIRVVLVIKFNPNFGEESLIHDENWKNLYVPTLGFISSLIILGGGGGGGGSGPPYPSSYSTVYRNLYRHVWGSYTWLFPFPSKGMGVWYRYFFLGLCFHSGVVLCSTA